MEKKIKNVFIFLILLLATVMIVGSIYYAKYYPEQEFDQIIYYALNGAVYTSPDVVNNVLSTCLTPAILLLMALTILSIRNIKGKIVLLIKTKHKKILLQIFPIKLTAYHRKIFLTAIFIIAMIITVKGFKIDLFLKYRMQESKIYDDYYVDGRKISIKFPTQKRNLVIIIAESMETTVLTKENGGCWDYSIVPELEQLAKRNINFSNSNLLGGARSTYGTTFSAAGILAITSGIPLIGANVVEGNMYLGKGNYLPGVYALGDVLKDNGYNLEVIMGSEGTFGARTQYFTSHGNYKIFDLDYAVNNNKMTMAEKVWWGFEDERLFKWSKEEVLKLLIRISRMDI